MQITENETRLDGTSPKSFRQGLSSFFRNARERFGNEMKACGSLLKKIAPAAIITAGVIALDCALIAGFGWQGYLGMRLVSRGGLIAKAAGVGLIAKAMRP